MKRIKWIAGGIVALVIIALVIVLMSLNSIVRSQVEVQTSSALDLKTTLGSANVSILGGSLGLGDLAVASPEGFSAKEMFALGGVKLGVSFGNLRADPIAVDKVVIDKPKLVIEQASGKFNFKALMDKASKKTPDGSEPVKLIIKELAINDAQVVVRPGIPGLSTEVMVPIPSFSVKDIGTGAGNQNGAAMKDVIMLVVMNLAQKASESGNLPPDVQKLLKLDVDQISRQIQGEIGKKIENITQDATKAIDKAIGEKGLGDLIKQIPGQQPK